MYRFLIVANVAVALAASLHLLLHYRRATTAVAWLFAVWVFPVVGALLYVMLAVYEGPRAVRRRKARAAAIRRTDRSAVVSPDSPAGYPDAEAYANLARLADRVSPFPMTAGNAVEILPSGASAVDAMLGAIAGARREVCLLTYILASGAVGHRLREALAARVRAGVAVRVLYDPFGSFALSGEYVESLRDAGVKVAAFLKPNPWKGRLQVNFRNHRKILVVDGEVAFTGGLNWADDYDERTAVGRARRDLHVRVRGPAVGPIRRVFFEDWCIATDEPMPPPAPHDAGACGTLLARVIPHGPDEEGPGLFAILGGALHRARRSVLLVTPYFVPGGTMLEALRIAALSGVAVRVLLPRQSDNTVADLAARRQFAPLLVAGAEILLAKGPFLHAKALVVDGLWTCLGSANFDQRSFHCNYELNLEIVDRAFAEETIRHFEPDLARAERVDAKRFARRSMWRRALENAAALFEPVL
jgi:cardiolipin synthase